MTSISKKEEFSQYFTPEEIVTYILDNSGFTVQKLSKIPVEKLYNLKVIDPAVGDGIFLVEAFKRLKQVMNLKKHLNSETDIDYNIIKNNLFGIDKDPIRVKKTINNLKKLIESKQKNIKFNVVCGNTLIPDKSIEPIANGLYDYVFGNPPYSKIISYNDKKHYFTKYQESIGGHPNLCTLFIHHSLKMLKPNGILGYLVAAPYLSSYYNRKLRKLLTKNYTLIELLRFIDRKKVIKGILQEFSILITENKIPEKEYFLKTSVTKDLNSLSRGEIKSQTVPFSYVVNGGDYNHVFLVCPSMLDYEIIHKIREKSKPLYEYCNINTGEIVQFRMENQINKSKSKFPIVEINNVKKFYLEDNFKNLYKPKKGRQYIKNKITILLKRLTSKEQPFRLVASLSPKKDYVVDNKLNILTIKNNKINIHILLGILNSILMDYYFRQYSSNTQVSANDIKYFPTLVKKTASNKIIETVKFLEENGFEKTQFSNLNKEIFDSYGLNEEEKNHIIDNGFKSYII